MGQRPSTCTVCVHPARHQVELGVVMRVPHEALARRFGTPDHPLSKDTIWRHSKNHLNAVQRAALMVAVRPADIDLDALKVSEGQSLLASLLAQRARLQQTIELAMEAGAPHVAVAAEGRITTNLELVSKLLGQLVHVHDVRHTSVLVSPDYIRLRQVLVEALKPHPAAALDVGRALAALEQAEAERIREKANGKAPLTIEHQAGAGEASSPVSGGRASSALISLICCGYGRPSASPGESVAIQRVPPWPLKPEYLPPSALSRPDNRIAPAINAAPMNSCHCVSIVRRPHPVDLSQRHHVMGFSSGLGSASRCA